MRTRLAVSALIVLLGAVTPRAATLSPDARSYLQDQLQHAAKLLQAGDYNTSLAVMTTLDSYPGLSDDDELWIGLQYNQACAYSLLNHPDEAFRCLKIAIDAGWTNPKHLRADTDLDNIRSDPRFEELLGRLDARARFWNNEFLATPYTETLSVDERVAGLSKLWSEVKYNFVFFDRVPEICWDSLYMAYLPRVRGATSTRAYYNLLTEMCAQLHDGHTGVNAPAELQGYVWSDVPFAVKLIDEHFIVVRVVDDSLRESGVVEGVELVRIDGVPVREYAATHVRPYQSASTPQALNQAVYYNSLFSRRAGDTLALEFQGGTGDSFAVQVPCGRVHWPPRPDVEFELLDHNVAHVSLNTFGYNGVIDQFDSLFEQISQADGLILDLRRNGGGNSSVGWTILQYIARADIPTISFRGREYRPAYRAWGRGQTWFTRVGPTYTPNETKIFDGPVVVLTSAATGSAAEDFCVSFDLMDRGPIIGAPTNGSTGQPLSIGLPGGGNARICTIHSTYPDRTEYVGVGVQPDSPVEITIDDVRNQRDPVLETAIKALTGTMTTPR